MFCHHRTRLMNIHINRQIITYTFQQCPVREGILLAKQTPQRTSLVFWTLGHRLAHGLWNTWDKEHAVATSGKPDTFNQIKNTQDKQQQKLLIKHCETVCDHHFCLCVKKSIKENLLTIRKCYTLHSLHVNNESQFTSVGLRTWWSNLSIVEARKWQKSQF